MTLDEMAGFARCNRRTAERLRDALREVFPQMVEVSEGGIKRFRIPAGGLDNFMLAPTADELGEVLSAATALEAKGDSARAALLRSVADKVQTALRQPLRSRLTPDLAVLVRAEGHALQAGPRPLADAGILAAIRHALKAGCMLRFGYGAEPGRVRSVAPWGLLYGRAYYLVGPEEGQDRPVLWRLDRIRDLAEGGAGAVPPEGWSIGAFAAQSFGVFQEEPFAVQLRFSAAAAADAERFLFHPTQVMAKQADGGLLVSFISGGMQEMVNHLFGWGTEVRVLEPPALRAALCARAGAALAHHGPG